MLKIRKALSLMLVLALVAGFAMTAQAAGFTPGTYTATGQGMGGDVKVEVVVTESEIQSVKVLEHKETPGISDPALEQIPEAIVKAQGLKVDGVTGATLTSGAILDAVKDCLTQAGGDVEALMEKGLEAEKLEDEEMTVDVVVAGGGIAGLSAAITAAKAGAKVVLVEKMGALGGASLVCGGEILAAGTQMQKDQGIKDDAESLARYWTDKGHGQVNEELLKMIADESADNVLWLKDHGVEFGKVTFSYNFPTQDPMRNHKTANGSGAGFILPLTKAAEEAGVTILLETPAVSLIKEEGVVKGLVANNKGRTLTIHAAGTILATGGYANNAELMKEYAPNIGVSGTFLGAAHQGDGLIMARDAGAAIVGGGGAIANPYDMGPTYYMDPAGIFLNVTPEGKRFCNEADYWFSRSALLYHELGFNRYFSLFDATNQHEKLEEAVAAGTLLKADSLEALAALMEVDPAVLTETVARYNQMCDKGEDSDFGKPQKGPKGVMEGAVQEVSFLNAIKEAPFYALKVVTSSVTGTFGGPKTTKDGEVLATDGKVIPGLYAAGEVANGELYHLEYPCSGSSIQFCLAMGRHAGDAAARAALAK